MVICLGGLGQFGIGSPSLSAVCNPKTQLSFCPAHPPLSPPPCLPGHPPAMCVIHILPSPLHCLSTHLLPLSRTTHLLPVGTSSPTTYQAVGRADTGDIPHLHTPPPLASPPCHHHCLTTSSSPEQGENRNPHLPPLIFGMALVFFLLPYGL